MLLYVSMYSIYEKTSTKIRSQKLMPQIHIIACKAKYSHLSLRADGIQKQAHSVHFLKQHFPSY